VIFRPDPRAKTQNAFLAFFAVIKLLISPFKQTFCTRLEGIGGWHEETKCIGQTICHVECKTNGKRVLDPLLGNPGTITSAAIGRKTLTCSEYHVIE
jgi:hypothetical protein